MIHQGIAFNWDTMETIQPKQSSHATYVRIGPFQNNLLLWHFTITGPSQSVYEQGLYHGRIILPKNYPASPPRIQMITPSGRFVPGLDICLSTASNYHPEAWTPRWSIIGIVDALRLHMLTTCNEIGGMEASTEERKHLAFMSNIWKVCISTKSGGRDGVIIDHSKMISLFFKKEGSYSKHIDNSMNNSDERKNDTKIAFIPQQQETKRKKKRRKKMQSTKTLQSSKEQYEIMTKVKKLLLQFIVGFLFGFIVFTS